MTGLAWCLSLAAVLVAAIFGASAYESIVVSYSWRMRPAEAVGHYRAWVVAQHAVSIVQT